MSKDLRLTGPDGEAYSYENIRTQSWLDGHRPGIEMAVGWLKNQAISLFIFGNDERAKEMRELAEKMEAELVGDKIICRRNNRDQGLYNGQPWTIVAPVKDRGGKLELHLEDEDGRKYSCISHPHHFLGIEDNLDSFSRRDAEEFDFSYALTVHRSQGSQWNKVALIDEWRWTETYRQWLYTGITRAAESIIIFKR